VRGRQSIGPRIGCVTSTVVQSDVVDVKSGAATDAEAVHRVVLDVDIVNRAASQNFAKLDKVVGPGRVSLCSNSDKPM
jgi:hypothetical protein